MEEKVEKEREAPGQREEELEIAWEKGGDRLWLPEEGDEPREEAVGEAPMPEEDETEVRQILEEARKRAEDVKEEELHQEYKRMVGIATVSLPEHEEKEGERVYYAKCGECGAKVPYNQLHDNGNYLVCDKCC
jgi:hypothetical protein